MSAEGQSGPPYFGNKSTRSFPRQNGNGSTLIDAEGLKTSRHIVFKQDALDRIFFIQFGIPKGNISHKILLSSSDNKNYNTGYYKCKRCYHAVNCEIQEYHA